MLLSVTAFFIGAAMPAICAALCQADICTSKQPAAHSCCNRPDEQKAECGSCVAQAELTAKKGPATTLNPPVWDAPPAILCAFEPIATSEPFTLPWTPIQNHRGGEPPPDPILARCLRSPPRHDA